jgi:hypothetical protein
MDGQGEGAKTGLRAPLRRLDSSATIERFRGALDTHAERLTNNADRWVGAFERAALSARRAAAARRARPRSAP